MTLKICKRCQKTKLVETEFYKGRAKCIKCYRDLCNEKEKIKNPTRIRKNNTKATREEGIVIMNEKRKRDMKKNQEGEIIEPVLIITPEKKPEKKPENKNEEIETEEITIKINCDNIVLSFKK